MAGRPAEGITSENVSFYKASVQNWINDRKLKGWLKEEHKEHNDGGVQAYISEDRAAKEYDDNIAFHFKEDAPDRLYNWCMKWLSDEGYARLKGNVRQKRYIKGGKHRGQPKRTVQIDEWTAYKLKSYADKQGQTMNEAILSLLDKVKDNG